MSTTFRLGQRIKITGTVEKQRDHVTWSPKDPVHVYREVQERWEELKAMAGNTEYGMLRTRLIETEATITEGVIVGKRTMAQGFTYVEEWPESNCFLPCERNEVWLVSFHLRRKPVMCFDHQVEAFPAPESITVPIPHVPYPGGRAQAHFMRTAARNLRNEQRPGGYNVTAAVTKLLEDTANAMEATK